MTGDLDLIKSQLIERIGELCRRLLPDGREESGQWVGFNPVTGDYKPGRQPTLKIRMRGGVVGAWKCWRCGDKGDVIGLVAYVQRTDTKGALMWARDFLGLKSMSRADREGMRKVEAERRVQRERDDERRRLRKLVAAFELFEDEAEAWSAERPSAAQKHAERYFAARRVPLDAVDDLNPLSLRFSRATEWWKGATYRSDGQRRIKTAPGPKFPAVHAGMRNALGIVTCCHVTFLDPNRPVKAPVDTAKLMYGEALGAVIEIAMGPNGVPFWLDDGPPQPVVLAEGIETALAFAVSGTPARIWACGSLAGIGGAPIDLNCIDWVLFARDNNDGNAQAQKQFSAALDQLEAKGKRVRVEASHVGDDFNDLAKGEE